MQCATVEKIGEITTFEVTRDGFEMRHLQRRRASFVRPLRYWNGLLAGTPVEIGFG